MRKSAEALTADLAGLSTIQGGYASPTTGTETLLAEVLADIVRVERVSVDSHFFNDLGADSLVMAQFCARVRKRGDLPSVSMKDIYQHPTIRSLATVLADAAPTPVTTGTETLLAEVLADIVRVERVSVDSHFFNDLGADSLVMAQFCARVRKRGDLPSVSMKDIYQHPTIRSLTTALAKAAPTPVQPAVTPVASSVPAQAEVVTPVRTRQYVLCGALQILLFLGYVYLAALIFVLGFEWIRAATGLLDIYVRSVLFGGATFFALCTLPILTKWVLIGRWKPQQIRVWSLAYVRFWFVKTLVTAHPMVLFAGSPLYVLYLRALGAKVGRGVVIFSRHLPVCTDLLTIGDGTVIRKDSFFSGYRAHAGWIQTGPVTLGKDVLVGEGTVLDIGTSMGDGAQLGHASSLHVGQAVPDGERWHGSPAQRSEVDYRLVDPARCGTLRRIVYSVLQLLNVLVLRGPLVLSVLIVVLVEVPQLNVLLGPGPLVFGNWVLYAAVLSLVFFFGFTLLGLLFVVTVPRVLSLAIRPDKVYRLYGIHYVIHRWIGRTTNRKFFTHLFGDSSYVVNYLRWLGYDLGQVEQTGSNFGTEVKHETPYLCAVGRGTMIADGLSIINADFSSTSFRVSRASIGQRCFLGNHIAYPSQSSAGDNCLLATKVMVPIDGPVREGVGLLGSPSFEIPRSVLRDSTFDHLKTGEEFRRGLAAKNRHNLVSMAWYLLTRWIHLFVITVLAFGAVDLYHASGALALVLLNVLVLLFSVVHLVLVERSILRFQRLQPLFCSIYDVGFWRIERIWKVPEIELVHIFNGTPFKAVIWRLLGVRLGKRLFDDGCILTERTLISVGDDCTLNAGSKIQTHSQEDGAYKSDRITVGAGCTIGVGALVHYGTTVGDGVVLETASFLMKGEEVPPHARWGGNPAMEMRNSGSDLQVRRAGNGSCGAARINGTSHLATASGGKA